MTLNKLKQIRNELKQNAEIYDEAFKNTALLAAEGLANRQKSLNSNSNEILAQSFDKKYFIKKYGNLKTAKEEYKRIYGNNNYGKSWKDFINAVKELPLIEQSDLTLEQRIARIENILRSMGHEL
jgi:hypothetical protein